jgi:methylenetetrahydrofolate dehydrogenase (NADP+)/methenyltetrahydrofolate cyclohydrolase
MADIFSVAAGVPDLIKPEWIRPGACIIEVDVDREVRRSTKKQGRRRPS